MWEAALDSLQSHIDNERLVLPHIVTLVNLDLRSSENRMWILNLEEGTVSHNVLVSHGRGGRAGLRENAVLDCREVSNVVGSNCSCKGGFATALSSGRTTAGSRGHTTQRIMLRVHGLDSTNNNAFRRRILFHGAWYVNATRAGRSQGCFATREHINAQIIPVIVGGSFVYAYHTRTA